MEFAHIAFRANYGAIRPRHLSGFPTPLPDEFVRACVQRRLGVRVPFCLLFLFCPLLRVCPLVTISPLDITILHLRSE